MSTYIPTQQDKLFTLLDPAVTKSIVLNSKIILIKTWTAVIILGVLIGFSFYFLVDFIGSKLVTTAAVLPGLENGRLIDLSTEQELLVSTTQYFPEVPTNEIVQVYSMLDLENINSFTKTIRLISLPIFNIHHTFVKDSRSVTTVEIAGQIDHDIIIEVLQNWNGITALTHKYEITPTETFKYSNNSIKLTSIKQMTFENMKKHAIPKYIFAIDAPLVQTVRFNNCNFNFKGFLEFVQFVKVHNESIENLEFFGCFFCEDCKLKDVTFKNLKRLKVLRIRNNPIN